jgi:hypothetical protein
MQTEQKKPQYINGRWQIVLDCGTTVRHADKHVLKNFLEWNDCRRQARDAEIRAAVKMRPTQLQVDRIAGAVAVVTAATIVLAVTAVAAWLW